MIDSGDGEKLERWGTVLVRRPDPQAIWPSVRNDPADAVYHRSSKGGGAWAYRRQLPASWTVGYPGLAGSLRFTVSLTGFKHTGLFPEQAVNWDLMAERIQTAKAAGEPVRILNLFAYTGGATAACALAGADEVVHVDSSRGMIAQAKTNLALSGGTDRLVRFINEDVNKFVEREIRRGRTYHGIVMDPPAYGRGPSGELWKLEDSLYSLIDRCSRLLDPQALFLIVNAYANQLSPAAIGAVAQLILTPQFGGRVQCDEIGLPQTVRGIALPCGCTARWTGADR